MQKVYGDWARTIANGMKGEMGSGESGERRGLADFALAAGLRVLSCYWSYIVQLGGKWGRTINTKEQGFSSSGAPMNGNSENVV